MLSYSQIKYQQLTLRNYFKKGTKERNQLKTEKYDIKEVVTKA